MGPWSIDEARAAANKASARQIEAEGALRHAAAALAEAERQYRMLLSQEITRLRAEGLAATTCADVARGLEQVADLRFARDVALGVRDAAEQAAWRLSADRRDVAAFIRWSTGVALKTDDVPDDRLSWTRRQAA